MNSLLLNVRHFSSSAQRLAGLVQPPLAVFGIEGRYATALYSAAMKEKKLDTVENELNRFQDHLKKDRKLNEFLENPLIKASVKREAMEVALKKEKFSNLVINLFGAMADNGRMAKVKSVINSFNKIMSAVRGELICEVTTAKPLNAELQKELQSALQGFAKKGEVLKIQSKVDPALIGGMIVSVGDRYVDMSTASKINLYSNLIKQAV